MKIFLSLFFLCVFISCNETTLEPTPEPEPCEVPIIYSGGGHILDYHTPRTITNNSNYLVKVPNVYEKEVVCEIVDLITSTSKKLRFNEFISENLEKSLSYAVYTSPYEENTVLFEILFNSPSFSSVVVNGINASRYYLYNLKNNLIKDITPLQYSETGVPRSLGIRFMTWLSQSTEGNDFFDCGRNGVFHLQTMQFVESNSTDVTYYSVGSSGNIKILLANSDTLRKLNNVPLLFIRNSIRATRISPDEKYSAIFVERQGTDYLWPYYFWEMYIIDVDKTIAADSMVVHSKIDFPTKLCAFQASSNFVITPNNTILISFSRYTIQEKSNLYEIDFNGKILRQLTNE